MSDDSSLGQFVTPHEVALMEELKQVKRELDHYKYEVEMSGISIKSFLGQPVEIMKVPAPLPITLKRAGRCEVSQGDPGRLNVLAEAVGKDKILSIGYYISTLELTDYDAATMVAGLHDRVMRQLVSLVNKKEV